MGGGGDDRSVSVVSAAARAFSLKKIRRSELVELNGLIVQKPATGFRKDPVWMSAPHPAVSTHVGSPPARLNALVDAILGMARGPWPTTLMAVVSLVRMLQVHPFSDGNGRSVRLYACWLVQRRIGPSPLFLSLLNALWQRSAFSIYSACIAIRDHDDWPPLLSYCLNASMGGAPSTSSYDD